MPAYNHQAFVRAAVESAWNQTYRNIELIVVDDGSSDDTRKILRKLSRQAPIDMELIEQENSGVASALNRALERSRGDWLCFLASDDMFDARFVERNLERTRDDSRQAALIQHCDAFLIESDGRISGKVSEISPKPPAQGTSFWDIAHGTVRIVSSSVFLPRDLLISVGAFDTTMSADDFDLHLRLSQAAEYSYVDEPLFYSRYSVGSLGRQPWRWGESIIRAVNKHRMALGAGYTPLIIARSVAISVGCFEYGAFVHGVRWAKRAIAEAPDRRTKLSAAAQLAGKLPIAVARNFASRSIGRRRLLQIKRALQSY